MLFLKILVKVLNNLSKTIKIKIQIEVTNKRTINKSRHSRHRQWTHGNPVSQNLCLISKTSKARKQACMKGPCLLHIMTSFTTILNLNLIESTLASFV